MMLTRQIIVTALFAALFTVAPTRAAEPRPNIVFIFIDDMGYGDLGCYGNPDVKTPRIDKLAAQGLRFTQFYVASPICSPSRVGITTGQHPARWRIHSYLASRQQNERRGMAHFLDPKAPAIARAFKQAGYATAHFGKWHQGGGRDVDDAPHPKAYGFDESLVSFEGLGDRVLPPGGLSQQSEKLGQGAITHVPKHELTEIYVNRSIDFITRNKDKPVYLHLWLNDVHDGHDPAPDQLAKFERFSANPYEQRFYAVLDEMDRQVGRLLDAIDGLGLDERTLIVLASDNGPTAWPSYERNGHDAPGHTGGLRGRKWSLYEGGVREPLIVRWTAKVPAGNVNERTVVSAIDFFPTFCKLAGVEPPEVKFDGVDMSRAMLGDEVVRDEPIFWEYGRDDSYLRPAMPIDRSPNLAVRDGKWKLLMNADGSGVELYDLEASPREYHNLAGSHPDVRDALIAKLSEWKDGLPDYPKPQPPAAAGEPVKYELKAGQTLQGDKAPRVADAAISIDAEIVAADDPGKTHGVIVAHGGQAAGYALYIENGRPAFTVRVRNKAYTIRGKETIPKGRVKLAAALDADGAIELHVNDTESARGEATLLNVQPLDPLNVGRDERGNVGDYQGDMEFNGTIRAASVTTRQLAAPPHIGRMVTRWAGDVDPDNPLPEYPRPQMVREQWLNLNGRWQYAIADKDAPQPDKWQGRIIVPFAVESLLSGVQQRVGEDKALWYRRAFDIPKEWDGQRVLLHFGAVDWEATVWVNGKRIGGHRGGYDPFSFDITDALKRDRVGQDRVGQDRVGQDRVGQDRVGQDRVGQDRVGRASRPSSDEEADQQAGRLSHQHEIIVRVQDPTDTAHQPRGKQVGEPKGIWYTPVTGIWQTVWLEPVDATYIRSVRVVPDHKHEFIRVFVDIEGDTTDVGLHLSANGEGFKANSTGGSIIPQFFTEGLTLGTRGAKEWSPDSPVLHGLSIRLTGPNLRTLDSVRSYFAMRKVELRKDERGVDRLFLNDKPLFHFGPLDQGWWPDGLYTAPTDDALRYDIEVTKQLGFNMARKHVKIEPARWYYWCDRLGLMVWQDMPSGMAGGGRGPFHVRKGQPDVELPPDDAAQFKAELKAMIDAYRNHPSIVAWVPFNEGWGQHDTNAILKWTKQYDPTRLVGGPSGWEDRGYGDFKDLHRYPGPDMFPVEPGRASVLGEFGGLGWPVAGHLWLTKNNWGYRSYATQQELHDAYAALIAQLPALIDKGLAAAVYTQTTDVEIEVNGLMTYDRAVIKLDAATLAALHEKLTGAK